MYPTLFHYIHTYGLMLAIAFLVGIWWVTREGKKQDIPPEKVMDLGLWVLIAAVVGARIAYVLPHWNEFAARPLSVVAVWEGGLTFYGGVLLAVPVGFFYMWKNQMPIWRTADLVAPAFALGVFFGRIGCLLNGCCFGLPTKLPWGISFPENCPASYQFDGARIHPSQAYESLAGLAIFGLLLLVKRKKRADGALFFIFVLSYNLWRFASDFWRYYDPQSTVAWGRLEISQSQIMSLALGVLSLVFLAVLKARSKQETTPRTS
jgi:phosphatidylglycerol:prolipoprotein diacylglycerol transferase